VLYLWRKLANKWVIKVEKLNVGGASIIFEKPEELFNQQIRNFMNTKRTLFFFDPERDNISDTLTSYYKTYEFIRENMAVYDTKSSQDSDYYKTGNKMIHTLNEFLTSHQSNYRRWFNNKTENMTDEEYNKCISEIQRDYRKYEEIIAGFEVVNKAFLDYGEKFKIDTKKWTAAQAENNMEE